MRTIIGTVCFLVLSACEVQPAEPSRVVRDGPFGIAMGHKLAELGAEPIRGRVGWHSVREFPKPHPLFTSLAVMGGEKSGVCIIEAKGPERIGDFDGIEVRADIEQVAKELALKYGQQEKFDTCETKLTDCREATYIANLRANVLDSYSYNIKDGDKLPPDIAGIILFPETDGSTKTQAVLRYFLKNRPTCEAEMTEHGAASL